MGLEMSKDLMSMNFEIPPSLRPVHPFLYDAQRGIINLQKHHNMGSIHSQKKIIVACISHAFELLNILNLEIDGEGKVCIDNYRVVRERFALDLGIDKGALVDLREYQRDKPPVPSHEILIAEADQVLALAEELSSEGFKFDAILNYHTACVYYRVMESMLPSLTGHVHQRLMYSAWRTRLGANLSHNFVGEHFEGRSCADVYEVHGSSKLGKGSYGSVYLATHRSTFDERAVKVMNVDRVTSYYLRKLHTEIAILKVLDHPNIIKLQDVFFGKRSVYLVTDLCRGGELFELLNSGKTQGFVFREDRAARLMRDMISAVHYLHSKGIVHRDLKLENFLFETKTSASPLILIDFGLSKHFEPDERLTQRVGSCYYTAPEVLHGNYDYRCDVWSLGVLCYMLLSGSPPFHGKTVEDVYQATLTQEPIYPDKKFRHLSPACMDFLRRLLVKDPNLRMSTAAALSHPFITANLAVPVYPGAHLGVLPGIAHGMPMMHGPRFRPDESDAILESIFVFVMADPLTKLILIMVAHSLPADNLQELRVEFQTIDADHNGTVSLGELTAALMTSQAVVRGEVDLASAYNAMCIERSHGHGFELTYHEYIAAAMCKRVAVEDCRVEMVFHLLDPDGQGYVTADSIRKSLGEDIPQQVLDAMIRSSPAAAALGGGVDPSTPGILTHDAFFAHWHHAQMALQLKLPSAQSSADEGEEPAAVGGKTGGGGGAMVTDEY